MTAWRYPHRRPSVHCGRSTRPAPLVQASPPHEGAPGRSPRAGDPLKTPRAGAPGQVPPTPRQGAPGRSPRRVPPPQGTAGKSPTPGRKRLHDRAPVGVQDPEALGDRQAREEGPAAAAHARLGQVDGDAGEARWGGGGRAAGGPDTRSAPLRDHPGPGRWSAPEKRARKSEERRRRPAGRGSGTWLYLRAGPAPCKLGRSERSGALKGLLSRRRPRLHANSTRGHAFYVNNSQSELEQRRRGRRGRGEGGRGGGGASERAGEA